MRGIEGSSNVDRNRRPSLRTLKHGVELNNRIIMIIYTGIA